MKITDMVDRSFFSLDTGDTLAFAAKKFAEKKISEAPVLQQGRLVGVLSTSDIASALISKGLMGRARAADPAKAGGMTAGRHLSQRPFYLKDDADVLEAISILARHKADFIPVADGKGMMRGVLWSVDVRKKMAEMLTDVKKGGKEPAISAAEASERDGAGGRTTIDQILRFVERKGSAGASEIAKQFRLPLTEVEEYAVSLEKHGLLQLDYDLLGKMKLRKKE